MRTLVFVAAFTTLSAILLALTAPERPTTDARVTSITLPGEAFADELLNVYGSVLLVSDEALDRRLRLCHVESGACATSGWGTVTGPGHWHGSAGNLRAVDAGTYRVAWTLHAPWGSDTTRAASRAAMEMTVHAAPE